MGRGLRRLVIVAPAKRSNAGESVPDVEGVGDLAELAVADDVDPRRDLLFHDFIDRGGQAFIESRLVEFTTGFPYMNGQQLGRPRQTPDMRGQDAVGADFHAWVVPSHEARSTMSCTSPRSVQGFDRENGRDIVMKTDKSSFWTIVAIGTAALLAAAPARVSGQQNASPTVSIGKTDLGGVVTGANGPEAGVWVIAETTGLPTAFAKIVVTDDQGHYVIPDLPQANYDVWVRGYGLIDSPRVITTPGKIVILKAVPAPNAAAAAQYYPAIYWYSMLRIPDQSQ